MFGLSASKQHKIPFHLIVGHFHRNSGALGQTKAFQMHTELSEGLKLRSTDQQIMHFPNKHLVFQCSMFESQTMHNEFSNCASSRWSVKSDVRIDTKRLKFTPSTENFKCQISGILPRKISHVICTRNYSFHRAITITHMLEVRKPPPTNYKYFSEFVLTF